MRIGLPGQYFDKETGKHYNYFRDYDPQLGRYIESDPIGLVGGTNTYAYVFSNPVKFMDTLGLEVTGRWIKAPHKGNLDITFNCKNGTDCLDFSSPEFILLNIQGSASLGWEVECKDSDGCKEDIWTLSGELDFVAGRQIAAPFPWCTVMPKGHKAACISAVAASLVVRIPSVRSEVIQDILDQADIFIDAFTEAYDPTKICKSAPRK